MIDQQDKPNADNSHIVRRLIEESGITEDQARELIVLLGALNWSSLLREARLLNPNLKPKSV